MKTWPGLIAEYIFWFSLQWSQAALPQLMMILRSSSQNGSRVGLYDVVGKHKLDEAHAVCDFCLAAITNLVSHSHLKLASAAWIRRCCHLCHPAVREVRAAVFVTLVTFSKSYSRVKVILCGCGICSVLWLSDGCGSSVFVALFQLELVVSLC